MLLGRDCNRRDDQLLSEGIFTVLPICWVWLQLKSKGCWVRLPLQLSQWKILFDSSELPIKPIKNKIKCSFFTDTTRTYRLFGWLVSYVTYYLCSLLTMFCNVADMQTLLQNVSAVGNACFHRNITLYGAMLLISKGSVRHIALLTSICRRYQHADLPLSVLLCSQRVCLQLYKPEVFEYSYQTKRISPAKNVHLREKLVFLQALVHTFHLQFRKEINC